MSEFAVYDYKVWTKQPDAYALSRQHLSPTAVGVEPICSGTTVPHVVQKADKTNKAVQVTISAVPEYSTDDLLALQKANPVISAVLSFCLQERFPSRSDRQNLPPDALGLLGRLVKEGVLHQRY